LPSHAKVRSSSLRAWTYRIAHNAVADLSKGKRPNDAAPDREAEKIQSSIAKSMIRMIDDLDPMYAQPL
jgi:DNA-directed RNA polymerase specialized sigma24 family protein